VDLCAAEAMAARPQTFGLNAEDERTARLYVLRASGRFPSDPWPAAPLNGAFVDVNDLITQATTALADKIDLDNPLTASIADVNSRLALFTEYGKPVFLIVPAAAIGMQWLDQLRQVYPAVSIVLLTGSEGWPPSTAANVKILAPPIAKGFEAQFWSEYDKSRQFLIPRRLQPT